MSDDKCTLLLLLLLLLLLTAEWDMDSSRSVSQWVNRYLRGKKGYTCWLSHSLAILAVRLIPSPARQPTATVIKRCTYQSHICASLQFLSWKKMKQLPSLYPCPHPASLRPSPPVVGRHFGRLPFTYVFQIGATRHSLYPNIKKQNNFYAFTPCSTAVPKNVTNILPALLSKFKNKNKN